METSNDFSHVSGITSPSISSIDSMYYYSAPSSPPKRLVNYSSGNSTEPTTPTPTSTYQETNSSFNLELFEIDTSHRFNHTDITDIGSPHRDVFHSMAFADELFCEGQVISLKPQLKLPPCLLSKTNVKVSKQNSTMSSLKFKSSLSSLKFPFSRHYLLNDDFDPFMVALEKVREQPKENNSRRTRSLSPLRAHTPSRSNSNLGFNLHQNKQLNPQQTDKYKQSPRRRTEPKGHVFVRKVRLVKLTHRRPNDPNTTTLVGSEAKTNEMTEQGTECCKRMTKKQKVKRFLLSGSIGKVTKEKIKDINEVLLKPTLLGRLSFKSVRHVECNKEKRVPRVRTCLIQYRTRLSLCLGYGTRHVH